MKILITGGCGFVGSHLALNAHEMGMEVTCMDNLYRQGSEFNAARLKAAGIHVVRGDVRMPSDFPAGAFDLLIECSAEPSVLAGAQGSTDYLMHTNLMGLYHCLEWCRKTNATLLFLSTSRVYPIEPLEAQAYTESETRFEWKDTGTVGIGPEGVSESLPMGGYRSLYGYTKWAGEQLIEEYQAAFQVKAIINRCGVIAGPWQFGKVDQGVVALWVFAHLFQRPLRYVGYGGMGKQVRDILHVTDLADLIREQIQNLDEWIGWRGNVAGGKSNSVSLRELTEICQKVTQTKTPFHPPDLVGRPNDLRHYIGDCTKLHTRTTWRPKRSISKTVEDISAWAMDHRAELLSLLG